MEVEDLERLVAKTNAAFSKKDARAKFKPQT
jgi:hypothetical protein